MLVEYSLDCPGLLPTDGTLWEDGAEPLDSALGERELGDLMVPRVPAAVVSRLPEEDPELIAQAISTQ